jgi:hypothetical protein
VRACLLAIWETYWSGASGKLTGVGHGDNAGSVGRRGHCCGVVVWCGVSVAGGEVSVGEVVVRLLCVEGQAGWRRAQARSRCCCEVLLLWRRYVDMMSHIVGLGRCLKMSVGGVRKGKGRHAWRVQAEGCSGDDGGEGLRWG